MNIKKMNWGEVNGQQAFLFEIQRGAMCARVSNFGGLLQSLYVKDARGRELDVVLGYDTPGEYHRSDTFFGAMVGPVADRISGGCCVLDGEMVQLPLNAGPDTMHSGPGGFHAHFWNWDFLSDGISFCRTFSEGETGFNGCMQVKLTYRIPEENVLRIEYASICDRETAVSFTNHSYFNLDGGERHCRDQILTVNASHYAQTERETDPVCTGHIPPVEGTQFDLRNGRRLGDVLNHTGFHEIRTGGGIDHYFPVDGTGMREHAKIESAYSGLRLSCRSDAPGVLVYSANGLSAEMGKNGSVYEKNWAICLETERFPNGVNLPEWREQVVLPAKTPYESATEFVFSII